MINICLNYEFVPPNFLFSMAKAFICLNGISNFCENNFITKQLLQEQIIEYMVKRSLKDCKNILIDSLKITPKVLENNKKYRLVKSITSSPNFNDLKKDIKDSLDNLNEILDLIKLYYVKEEESPSENIKQKYFKI